MKSSATRSLVSTASALALSLTTVLAQADTQFAPGSGVTSFMGRRGPIQLQQSDLPTVPPAKGGLGTTSLSGIPKCHGASGACTPATADAVGADYASPAYVNTIFSSAVVTVFGTSNPAIDGPAVQAAIFTGKSVFLIGTFDLSEQPEQCPNPGQRIFGAGRLATRILVFTNTTHQGFLFGATGISNLQGPEIDDLSVFYPNQTDPTSIVSYPTTFYFPSVNRPQFHRLGIYGGTVGFNLVGSGGATADDIQIQTWLHGFEIDAAFDQTTLNLIHWWPHTNLPGGAPNGQMTTAQSNAWYASTTGRAIYGGRIDDFIVTNSLFLGATALDMHLSTNGVDYAFGTFTACDFDSTNFGTIAGGKLTFKGGAVTLQAGSTGPNITGGFVTFDGTYVSQFGAIGLPIFTIASGAKLVFANSPLFTTNSFDNQGFQNAGTLILTGNIMDRYPGTSGAPVAYNQPVVYSNGGQVIVSNNYQTPLASGSTGLWLYAPTDLSHKVSFNSSIGWTYIFPGGSARQAPNAVEGASGNSYFLGN
ncbi:hypothetical protein [Beijerinckia sp. L45]|uniref:hypothetical protein n=1 Tax=Beijerinckia sp. L45 TaxID=1641855 RepID=UPI00131CFD17|nr:hypothetical protein [Beijerinckia sp. L45]